MPTRSGANRPDTTFLALNSLTPYEQSARTHSRAQRRKLASVIRRFGQITPIIVNQDRLIIDGHAVWEALRELGHDEAAVLIVAGRTDPDIRALRLALNKLPSLAGWDNEKLRQEIQYLIDASYDLDITGFEPVEIDHLLDIDYGGEVIEGADTVPPQNSLAVSHRGDVWVCGPHRIGCGDALDLSFVQKLTDGHRPGMCFTDPPYNLPVDGFASGNGATRHREFHQASGEMSEAQFTAFLAQALQVLKSVLSDGGLAFVCMDWRHIYELLTAARQASIELANICVWAKSIPGLGLFYRSQHEFVTILKAGDGAILNNMALGKLRRNRSNLWSYRGMNSFGDDRDDLVKLHPTVKPVALIADAIRDVTKRGDAVIDTFCGSGSTVMAAEETGRIAYGVEIDPLYVDVAVRRWQEDTKADAVHLETGEIFEDRAARLAKASEA